MLLPNPNQCKDIHLLVREDTPDQKEWLRIGQDMYEVNGRTLYVFRYDDTPFDRLVEMPFIHQTGAVNLQTGYLWAPGQLFTALTHGITYPLGSAPVRQRQMNALTVVAGPHKDWFSGVSYKLSEITYKPGQVK